jgi:hypothetical protein
MKGNPMDDHETMEILREALSPGPSGDEDPPDRVVEGAYAAGSWVVLDAQLAELVADSAHTRAAMGVRAPLADPHQMTYRLHDLTVECELDADALLGEVTPAQVLRLELVQPDGTHRPVDLDADGRFLVRPRPRGPVAIRCTRTGGPAIVTPWFLA